jgi:Zn ribbon nucleic-acid-binding protein
VPISQRKVFKCSECGYREVRMVGDVLPSKSTLKPCPKCGGFMKMTDDEVGAINKAIEKILRIFK